MDLPNPTEAFSELSYYSAHFMDLAIWEPFVQRMAAEHGFNCVNIRPGLPGTYPTFITELGTSGKDSMHDSIVVKFFGPLFDGATAHQTESVIGRFLEDQPISIRSPKILAEGRLSPAWTFLVFEYIPGVSLGQVRDDVSRATMQIIARQMGEFMREFHKTTGAKERLLPTVKAGSGWGDFTAFLKAQRQNCLYNHTQWDDLPSHLLEQIPGFIPQVEELLDYSSPSHLIHADLTADHLIGRIMPDQSGSLQIPGGNWGGLAIIDWGDCRVGNILYELVALHMDLFQADKQLLRTCLEAYGLPAFYQHNFAHKALAMVLLHQFPMPRRIYTPHQHIKSLDELAERIFGLT